MAQVDLGYSEPCENWRLQNKFFPSKIGGKPAWLSLEGVPTGEELNCSRCGEPTTFLCQIYAPYEEDDNNFHRTIFVFVCRKNECHENSNLDGIIALRSSLKRENNFYSYDPPLEEPSTFPMSNFLNLCEVCGCQGTKNCSRCKSVHYCSKTHQVIDWKEKHKNICGQNIIINFHLSKFLYPETEIVIEPEEIEKKEVDEEQEKQKYLNLIKDGNCTLTDADETELNQFSTEDTDITFSKFRKRVDANPDQVLRYDRGGIPLLISNEELPEEIPNCEHCGGPRRFEFQVMPQMLSVIKELDIDWGVLICYTCTNSCTEGVQYKREFIFKQNVSSEDC